MSLCGFGQFGDWRVASLCCYGRLVLDRECSLSVPNAFIDSELIVDIGGIVEMPFTTINFMNSTIDFTGASIIGFSGNIEGNLFVTTVSTTVLTANVVIANKIFGTTYCGNVVGDVIGDVTGNVSGEITGNACFSELNVDAISSKTPSGTIVLLSPFDNVCTPNLFVDIIEPKTGDTICIDGNIEADFFIGNITGTFVGNTCGAKVETNFLFEKTMGAGISVEDDITVGNIIITGSINLPVVASNVGCFNNLFVDEISIKTGGGPIIINNSINVVGAEFISVFRVTVSSLLSNDSTGNIDVTGNIRMLTGTLFGPICSDSIKGTTLTDGRVTIVGTGGVISDHVGMTYDTGTSTLTSVNVKTSDIQPIIDNTYITMGNISTGNICVTTLFVDVIDSKTDNEIHVIGNILVDNIVIDSIAANTIVANSSITTNNVITSVVCTSNIKTTYIFANTANISGNINGNINVMSPTLFNDDVSFCGNIFVGNIHPKELMGDVTIFGEDITINAATITLNGSPIEFGGNLAPSGISGSTANSYVGIFFDTDHETIAAGVGGAISVLTYYSDISTDGGGDFFTLAIGSMTGQLKSIRLTEYGGGDAVISPAGTGVSTISMKAGNVEIDLLWNGSGWKAIKSIGFVTLV